uniref:Uncharacterized protein n=1 Tax=Sparus aurata TaxID=8175 RepID=A0A671WCX0_SPAAU
AWIFGALIPSYGFMASLDQIRDLSHAVEDFANSTAKDMSMLSQEMTTGRMMTLQIRAALASQGGTCAVIGTGCCMFIPDHNATLQEITNHLKKIHIWSGGSPLTSRPQMVIPVCLLSL